MKRIELACYSLILSAFLLSATLIYFLENRLDTQANANAQVLTRESFTLMTTKVRVGGGTGTDDEALFVLSNAAQKVLVYRTDRTKGFYLANSLDLAPIFSTGNLGAAGGGGGGHMSR